MKKITDLFEKLANHQLDANETKNIKGGHQGIGNNPGDPPGDL